MVWSRATAYAAWFSSPLGGAYKSDIQAVIAPWIAAARPRRALDAGCGPIATFAELFERETGLVAVDCSLEIARSAREMLRARPGPRAVCCGSVERLPFAAREFDFILSMNCLEFVSDRRRALAEFRRVARPGATAVIGVLNRRGLWELTRRMRRPFASSAYYAGRFLGARELASLLAEAGWRVEDARFTVRFPPLSLPRPSWYRAVSLAVPETASGVVIVRARAGD